jgi:anti-anti-sigma factor
MEIKIRPGKVPVIDVKGDIDHYTAPDLEQQFLEIFKQGSKSVVFDFSEVPYIDSAGVAVLILAIRKAEQEGGRIGLVTTNRDVLRILEIVGITGQLKNFHIFSSQAEAVEVVKGRKGLTGD